MNVTELFVELAKIRSDSADYGGTVTPSTERQFDIANYLAQIMPGYGLNDVYVSEHSYVYGTLPPATGYEGKPAMALIAHIDTVHLGEGEKVCPVITENYNGEDLPLSNSGRILSVETFPHLKKLKGQTLITTDGRTVLGSDDKAGVAEILTAVKMIVEDNIPHGRVVICFTPDEEIGHGAEYMDLDKINADFGFTVDGGEINEINYETFNANLACFEISGVSVHPGSAKGVMINAALVAAEIISMLPKKETPAHTEGYEGFYHVMSVTGACEKARIECILRDHSEEILKKRREKLWHIKKKINLKYGEGTVKLTVWEQYRNMARVLKDKPEIIKLAKKAVKEIGLTPEVRPVRGGTDGSRLSFRGLPCPNLGTGGYAFHGPYEHITKENLELGAKLVYNIIKLAAE